MDEIELVYEPRDYGYYISNDRGYASIITLLGSYYVTAVIHGTTYVTTFCSAEEAYKALHSLYNTPAETHPIFTRERRVKGFASRIYRWVYEFIQAGS